MEMPAPNLLLLLFQNCPRIKDPPVVLTCPGIKDCSSTVTYNMLVSLLVSVSVLVSCICICLNPQSYICICNHTNIPIIGIDIGNGGKN